MIEDRPTPLPPSARIEPKILELATPLPGLRRGSMMRLRPRGPPMNHVPIEIRTAHCWAEGPVGQDGCGTTCMLPPDHPEPHRWTRDDRVIFEPIQPTLARLTIGEVKRRYLRPADAS